MPASAAIRQRLVDLGLTGVAVEEPPHVVGVEPGRDGLLDQDVGVADVAAVDEVGGEQALLQLGLGAGGPARLRVPQQPVGVTGVRPLGPVEVEVQALGGGGGGDVVDDQRGLLRAAELAARRPRRRASSSPVAPSDRAGTAGRRSRSGWRSPGRRRAPPPRRRSGGCRCSTTGRRRRTTLRRPREPPYGVGSRIVLAVDAADVQATFCATLVDELVVHGVRHAVVAPGSRSTPMALALTARPDVRVHVVHDERAAAFVALGLGLGGTPAVLLCTSGTAAANFHPAVVEAGLSDVPMIVITADRPPELRDVGAPQTIDQTHLFGRSVRWFHDPGVADAATSTTWRSLAARARVAARTGPVHLNLPFREPLVGRPGALPPRRRRAGGPHGRRRPGDVGLARRCSTTGAASSSSAVVGRPGGSSSSRSSRRPAGPCWPTRRRACERSTGAVAAFDALLRHALARRRAAPRRGRAHRPSGGVEGPRPVGRRVRRTARAGRRARRGRSRPRCRRPPRTGDAAGARRAPGRGRGPDVAARAGSARPRWPRRRSTTCSARRRR